MILDAFERPHPEASNGQRWELVTDRVMGGRSTAAMARERVAGREALRLTGSVSLENDGGFLQIALDLAPEGAALDLSECDTLELDVYGPPERYNVHLRDRHVVRPWQSHRASFTTSLTWQRVRLPLAAFTPHRVSERLDQASVRRLGIVAIGRAFEADLALARLGAVPCDPPP
ncbi:MAG: CIA30 family protein [Pseudomonadota bacterium]